MESLTDGRIENAVTCKSCENVFHGNFCNQCGEKVLRPKDRTFKSFWKEVKRFLQLRDNVFLRSLSLIVVSPGFLSKEFVEGRRVRYTQPLQIFFALNVIYFLFPVLQLFNISLNTQMYLRTYSPWVRSLVESKLKMEGFTYQGYSLMFNEKSTALAKMLIIVFVFLASLPFNIIYRKKNRFFTDHLTLSIEMASFNLAINAIFLSLVLMITSKVLHWTHSGWNRYLDDLTLTIIFSLSNFYFLFTAGRIFYQQSGIKLLLKVVLGMAGIFVALEIYRLMLFLVTFWTL